MKAIAICGSPRKNGNTEIMLKEALKGAQKEGAKTELIQLAEKNIKYCLGHDDCGYPCKIKDDMDGIYKKLIEADIIIIGSPVYYCNVSGLLKNFMDRCTCLTKGLKLENKIGAAVTVSGFFAGNAETEYHIWDFLNWQGVTLPGRCTVEGYAEKKEGILKRKDNLKSARELGERLVDFYKEHKK
jgi:multimeric flavodoxin WrbA